MILHIHTILKFTTNYPLQLLSIHFFWEHLVMGNYCLIVAIPILQICKPSAKHRVPPFHDNIVNVGGDLNDYKSANY